MQVTAKHRYLRQSPTKVRLVLPAVRGQRADVALAYLRLMPQAAATPVAKVLKSAVANAEHNYSLDPASLVVARATADEGPTMKRFMPGARGRAKAIHRRSTHVTIILEDVAGVAAPGVADKIKNQMSKVAPKRPKKAEVPVDEEAADETKKQAAKAPKKTAAKAKSPASPDQTEKTPEVNEQKAQAAARRTEQQTGRGATTRKNKPSSGNKGKDKS